MATFLIHLIGQHQPLMVDIPVADVDALWVEASRMKFIIGDLAAADEAGVFRRVMISTYRIQCVVESG